MRHPVAKGDDDGEVDNGAHAEDAHSADDFDQRAEADGADGVTHAVADHDVADHVHAQPA